MQRCLIVLLGACGAATTSAVVSGAVSVTTTVDEAPREPAPESTSVHLHETPSYIADANRLYVEITADDEHADVLRQSATAGLTSTSYVVAVADGGDVELQVEVASLTPATGVTSCQVKIFVLRLPQHDLLAIADGGARITGRDRTDQCLSATSTAIVREKLPLVFRRQLDAKQ